MWFLPLILKYWKVGVGIILAAALAFAVHEYNTHEQELGRMKAEKALERARDKFLGDASFVVMAQRDSLAKQLDSLRSQAPAIVTRWRAARDGTVVVHTHPGAPGDTTILVPLPDSVKRSGDEVAAALGKCLSDCDQFRIDTKLKEEVDGGRIRRAEYNLDSVLTHQPSHWSTTLKATAVGAALGAGLTLYLQRRGH